MWKSAVRSLILTVVVCSIVGAVIDSASVCADERLRVSSLEYFNHGELLVDSDQPADSVAFFRTAVRMCPFSLQYLLRLGQIEHSLRIFDKAWRRFAKARTLPDLSDDDITIIEEWITNEDFDIYRNNMATPLVSTLSFGSFPEFAWDTLTVEAWQSPFVIRNAFEMDSTLLNLSNFEHLKDEYGELKVEFYPQNMQSEPDRMYSTPMREAVEFFEFPDGAYVSCDASESGTYLQWNINASLFDKLAPTMTTLPMPIRETAHNLNSFFHSAFEKNNKLFETESERNAIIDSFASKTHWFMLLMGEEGSGMFMHVDNLPVSSWQMQLRGEKRWRVCPPRNYEADPQRPRCLHFNETCADTDKCIATTLHPGDLLYYPPGYFHETLCQSPVTTSISGTILFHPEQLANVIRDECVTRRIGYAFDDATCKLFAQPQPKKRMTYKKQKK